jgi:hypothetical protein
MMIRSILAFGFMALWLQGTAAVAQTQVCVPQFVDGIMGPFQWRTTLVLQNQDQMQSQVQLNFYDTNGAPFQGLAIMRRGGSGSHLQVGPAGQLDPEPIQAHSAAGYQSGGQGAMQAGYVMIQSQNRIHVQSRLQLMDSAGNVVSEAIVVPGAQFRQAGFYADRGDGTGIGLALTNPSASETAICTLEVIGFDESILGTTQIPLGPHSQTARFLSELFPGVLMDDVGFVRINCSEPVCALAIHMYGFLMSQIPIVIED